MNSWNLPILLFLTLNRNNQPCRLILLHPMSAAAKRNGSMPLTEFRSGFIIRGKGDDNLGLNRIGFVEKL